MAFGMSFEIDVKHGPDGRGSSSGSGHGIATYALGIAGNTECKNVEPIAAAMR